MNKKEEVNILYKYYKILCDMLFEDFDINFYDEQYLEISKLYHSLNKNMTLDDFKSALFINIHFKEKHSELPVIEAKYFYSINSTIKFSKTYNKIISNYLKKEQ
mgnify:CR=1 FL=1|jgi:hypothetical protein